MSDSQSYDILEKIVMTAKKQTNNKKKPKQQTSLPQNKQTNEKTKQFFSWKNTFFLRGKPNPPAQDWRQLTSRASFPALVSKLLKEDANIEISCIIQIF